MVVLTRSTHKPLVARQPDPLPVRLVPHPEAGSDSSELRRRDPSVSGESVGFLPPALGGLMRCC